MSAERTPEAAWRAGLSLAVVAAVCAAIVALTWSLTAGRIAANRQAMLEQQFRPVLEGVAYTRIGIDDPLTLPPPHALPGDEPARVYFAWRTGTLAAYVFEVSASGYAGPIRLLIGVTTAGEISGVRVIAHRETPGLGDRIEASRTDWIRAFDGRSLGDPPAAGWALTRDGGRFDQLTGATVTTRAVVRAVKATLVYSAGNGAALAAAARRSQQDTDDG